MEDCPICCFSYTNFLRKPIQCKICKYDVCTKCVKTYLLDTVKDPHCMKCNIGWDREFIDNVLSKAFRIGELKKHRENLLLDRERGMLLTTMPLVEIEIIKRKNQNEIIKLNKEKHDFYKQIVALDDKINEHNSIINGNDKKNIEIKVYQKPCPANDCRGFLSNWKCSLCNVNVCSTCNIIKEEITTQTQEHKCKDDDIATAKLLEKDTRHCPNNNCRTPIFKIDGCFAQDTSILMWDGNIKMSQDIKIGDILIGDNGYPRNVLGVVDGEDNMYEVTQINGCNYTVNSQHKLVLKFKNDRIIKWRKSLNAWIIIWFDHNILNVKTRIIKVSINITKDQAYQKLLIFKNTLKFPDIIEIPVIDYMKLAESWKRNMIGCKCNLINWPSKNIQIDPYLIGNWIGDEINNGNVFATNNKEILEYIIKWCNQYNAELIYDSIYKFIIKKKNKTLDSSFDINKCDDVDSLKEIYNLIKNKYIPQDIIINDRKTRMQLLAGIIDINAYISKDRKKIQLPQINWSIARQIKFVACSLGFTVSINKCSNPKIKDYEDKLMVNISGEHLHEIPTLLFQKNFIAIKKELITNISVKHIGKGNYYGWQIDGNKRFLLNDLTLLRNCDQMFCTKCHTAFSWKTGEIVYNQAAIHNPHFYEWIRKQNNGQVPRTIENIPCGGLQTFWHINDTLKRKKITIEINKYHRGIQHIIYHEIPAHPINLITGDIFTNLRIRYIMNELSENDWKKELQKIEKKNEKNIAFCQIFNMFSNVVIDMFNDILQLNTNIEVQNIIIELDALRLYFNDSIVQIYKRFDSKAIKQMNNEWIYC